MCVPEEKTQVILDTYHASPVGAHYSGVRTLQKCSNMAIIGLRDIKIQIPWQRNMSNSENKGNISRRHELPLPII